jgi:hypothetical protein
MTEEYTVPKEIDEILSEAESLLIMRDLYVKLPFGYRKAVKCAKQSEILRREFWRKLYALYPLELSEGSWTYHPYTLKIIRKGL